MGKNIAFKIIFVIGNLFVILLSICVLRTVLLFNTTEIQSCKSSDSDYISDNRGLSKRLSDAIKFKTINIGVHDYDRNAIASIIAFINRSFPLLHSSSLVSREVVNNLSLLYYIQGSNRNLKPYLLAGHLDVVPVEESYWEESPFSGVIKDGYIWGRGTIDCKHVVMGILEAVEFLLENGHQPQRSFYLAFGHDEESDGLDGAQHISKLLRSRNVQLEYILDEGTFVMDNLVPGVNSPIALIGVTEKGSLNLELKVNITAGHSSLPHKETAIVILAKALSKLEGDVFPSVFGQGPEKEMFEELAHCAPFPLKVVLTNIWLFKPLMIRVMSNPIMSSIHRTTTAVTVVKGGTKINVLPSSAMAQINLRVHPAQTTEEAAKYVKKIINDERVQMSILSVFPPHPISPTNSFGFKTIKMSIRQIYNDSCVAPSTLVANTDTRWYLGLTDSIYRFSLVRMTPNETRRFHGHNEKIEVENYVEIVNFFLHLIKNSDLREDSIHNHEEL